MSSSAGNGKEKITSQNALATGYGMDALALTPVAVKGSTPVPALDSSTVLATPLKASKK